MDFELWNKNKATAEQIKKKTKGFINGTVLSINTEKSTPVVYIEIGSKTSQFTIKPEMVDKLVEHGAIGFVGNVGYIYFKTKKGCISKIIRVDYTI